MSPAAEHWLEVPGARIRYETRGAGPVLIVFGVPLPSSAFAPLAERLAHRRTVVTFDPRGFARSTVDNPDEDLLPDTVAEDLHRLLLKVASGPAQVFGTSGGAVTGLALVARHSEQVATLVAHEPPVVEALPEAERAREHAATEDVYQTFRTQGSGAAWPKFMAMNGFAPSGPVESPPDPSTPSTQDDADGDRMLAHWMRPCVHFRPDLRALRAAPTRIVAGLGDATTADQLVRRATQALVAKLGLPVVTFPGGHTGFMSEPDGFADALEKALDDRSAPR